MELDLNFFRNVLEFNTLPSLDGVTDVNDNTALQWIQYKVAEEIVADPSKLQDHRRLEEIYKNQVRTIINPPAPPPLNIVDGPQEQLPILPPVQTEEKIEEYRPPLAAVGYPENTIVNTTRPLETPVVQRVENSNRDLAFFLFILVLCASE
jgi:hypothetical protein